MPGKFNGKRIFAPPSPAFFPFSPRGEEDTRRWATSFSKSEEEKTDVFQALQPSLASEV